MWCGALNLFVNEETEATKVQWLDKVRAGEWWVMYVKSRYPESNIQLSSLTGEGCLVPDSSRIRTVGSLSACLSLLPVSLFTQHLYSPLSLFPFPSFLCLFQLGFWFISGWFCVVVTQLCLTLCDPVDCSPQALLSTGFPRQEHWSGCHSLLHTAGWNTQKTIVIRWSHLQQILWQGPQEGYCNETFINYSRALSWLHALVPYWS